LVEIEDRSCKIASQIAGVIVGRFIETFLLGGYIVEGVDSTALLLGIQDQLFVLVEEGVDRMPKT
jgi:hypothetical protein